MLFEAGHSCPAGSWKEDSVNMDILNKAVKKRDRTHALASRMTAILELRRSAEDRAVAAGPGTSSTLVQTPFDRSLVVCHEVHLIEIKDSMTPLPLRRRFEEGETYGLVRRAVESSYPSSKHDVIELLHED
jgi:hypothetical protein